MPSWSSVRRQVDEYMHGQYNISILSCASDFPVFEPHRLTTCSYAAVMLSAESPAFATFLQPVLGAPTFETLHYHSVCASFLSALDVIEWSRPNHISLGPLNSTQRPPFLGGADIFALNSSIQTAIQRIKNSHVSTAVASFTPCQSDLPMGGNVPPRMSRSPPSLVPVPSTNVKTSPFPTAPY